ncbi:MAG TPA: hypothetical protein VMT62_17930 [Syntrophorhabdaceae bacterium]|nr:hypothetical protein [Syntrophorhabdaceae bacterium]
MKETVKKIDSAQRQLDTAIELWFKEGDPISVHTLACSAYQIIHDINSHRKGRDLLLDTLVIKDEYMSEFRRCLKASYNFFKHADQEPDPDGTIEFDAKLSEYFMLYAIIGLELNGIMSTTIRKVFVMHYVVHNPHVLTQKGKEFYTQNIPSEKIDDIRKLGRNEFFENIPLILGHSWTE